MYVSTSSRHLSLEKPQMARIKRFLWCRVSRDGAIIELDVAVEIYNEQLISAYNLELYLVLDKIWWIGHVSGCCATRLMTSSVSETLPSVWRQFLTSLYIPEQYRSIDIYIYIYAYLFSTKPSPCLTTSQVKNANKLASRKDIQNKLKQPSNCKYIGEPLDLQWQSEPLRPCTDILSKRNKVCVTPLAKHNKSKCCVIIRTTSSSRSTNKLSTV